MPCHSYEARCRSCSELCRWEYPAAADRNELHRDDATAFTEMMKLKCRHPFEDFCYQCGTKHAIFDVVAFYPYDYDRARRLGSRRA